MIRLTVPTLQPGTIDLLKQYQQELTAVGDYTAQVRSVEAKFNKYNTRTNAAFSEVRARLVDMCCGAIRCHYCEDSEGDSVEHHAPKSLYPNLCFDWDNFLYACTSCNRPKRTQYAVFDAITSAVIHVPGHPRKSDGEQLAPPPAGVPVLLNPRIDNPLDYLFLDIQGRFEFSIFVQPGTSAYERAEYTRNTLRLNRPALYQAREAAYTSFRTALENYVSLKNANGPQHQLVKIQQVIQRAHHQTVWQEMKRQHNKIPELATLFAQAPEALGW
ncbi:aminoglycoside phosphotransferase [Fibrella sp. HMF5335]|uniref:Aminoglycoside phosphotransferase n=1 Tax=Fibrella rubiginis TaxID=2817060 RepID=A0A939GNH9_9BACT|nr:aminoglycoside phosphotransferase [Fibrella rubiginis]MBO0939693.1 aminoglycoside phosphotransferase [Fibrella rubiginis]